MWRFRGSPHYIDRQGERLGIPKAITDRARHNPEIHRISVLIGQFNERYHRGFKDNGIVLLSPAESEQVRGTLRQCDQELEKLHVLAAAAQQIIDEAYEACGLHPPNRPFRVSCEFDSNQ